MPKARSILQNDIPEVFFYSEKLKDWIYRQVKAGAIRKIASRLYTKNLKDSPEVLIRRNLWPIVSFYFPACLIADRTAIELRPTEDGSIFLISDKKNEINLPGGITLKPRKGLGAINSDKPFIGGIYLSSQARAVLESMQSFRSREGKQSRGLSKKEVEEKLEDILRRSGEGALLKLRDEARLLARDLSLEAEFKTLDEVIGSLLGTRDVSLSSDIAIMRKLGKPYDSKRLQLFQLLSTQLQNTAPISRLAINKSEQEMMNLAFFDAYFSNFIEGTEFAVDEAQNIIFEGKIPENRPQDAHDVLGTFKIVSDIKEMHRIPKTIEDFTEIIKYRHAEIMGSRKEKLPGEFKRVQNQAGSTLFVAPELVEGTFLKGFEFYQTLDCPLHRAIFMMFLVSEVHPFVDGNGRLARIMMNAELVAKGEQRIIIPTIFRNNYLQSLKALSLNSIADPIIRTLDYAQKYTNNIDWTTLNKARKMLDQTNAFRDPNEADMLGIRLKMPEI